ncbi:MAG: hypothetical protein IRY98_01740 [Alicyclobacillaceae bacterium]|nr:hypothetical protein [Alicyclobacillaceae bacterium]
MPAIVLHTGQASAKRLERRLSLELSERDISPEPTVYIRWGSQGGSDPQGIVLNRQQAIRQTADRERVWALLSRYGIRTPPPASESDGRRLALVRQYRIPVFDHAALSCFRSNDRNIWLNKRLSRLREDYAELSEETDQETIRACRLAVRTTHALGLDFALVSLGITSKGRLYVLDVSPTPVLHGRLLDLFSHACIRYVHHLREGEGTSRLILGADLEFMLRGQSGKIVLASRYFPRKGEVGCDDRTLHGDAGKLPLAEVRPTASASPIRLVQHIREALIEAARLCPSRKVKWLAGSMPFRGFPIGGHIHFSGISPGSRLVRALDTYIGLPVALMEDPQTARIRRRKYGFLGDVRRKSHGGFEYRTPGSWLVSPEIATAVLCLAHIVAQHYRDLEDWPFDDPGIQSAFYASDRKVLKPVFTSIWKSLSQVSLYEEYEDYLSIIPWMIERDLTWDESVDIRETWDVPAVRKRAKSKVGIR